MECLVFCLMPVVSSELDKFKNYWNNHRVRNMKNCELPSGVPNVLFASPEIFGFKNMGCSIDKATVANCFQLHTANNPDCNITFEELALTYLLHHKLKLPSSIAIDLFAKFVVQLHTQSSE